MIAKKLDHEMKAAISMAGSEPEIVKNYTLMAGLISPTPTVKVKAAFIHQRPYVFFINPTGIVGREKCELGDIMYIFKKIDVKGNLIDSRVAFVQVKKGAGSWYIEPHQLEFLFNIKTIQFRFGNSVYKLGGYAPVIYNGLPHVGNLAQYLLLDLSNALSYSVKRIKKCQKLFQQGFPIHKGNPVKCKEASSELCFDHDSNLEFLKRFCSGNDGAKLTAELRDVVELIYKRVGWVLDPPEEFADNFIDDPRGFSIIEITSTVEIPNEEKRG